MCQIWSVGALNCDYYVILNFFAGFLENRLQYENVLLAELLKSEVDLRSFSCSLFLAHNIPWAKNWPLVTTSLTKL